MTDFELQIKHAPFHLDQVSNNLSFEKPNWHNAYFAKLKQWERLLDFCQCKKELLEKSVDIKFFYCISIWKEINGKSIPKAPQHD